MVQLDSAPPNQPAGALAGAISSTSMPPPRGLDEITYAIEPNTTIEKTLIIRSTRTIAKACWGWR